MDKHKTIGVVVNEPSPTPPGDSTLDHDVEYVLIDPATNPDAHC